MISENEATRSDNGNTICFVALGAYPILTGKNSGFVGGPSVQQVFLAAELHRHNNKIIFITYGNDEKKIECFGDYKIIKVYKREDTSNLSFFTKIWYIWSAMKIAKADCYIHRSGAAGVVSLYCMIYRKKFVRYISSDAEVNNKNINILNYFDKLGNWLDFKLANIIIAQSEFQQKMIKQNFGKDCDIIKTAFPLPILTQKNKDNSPIILWVSTIREIKQPELFLKLAKSIPEGKFQMIGGIDDSNPAFYEYIKKESQKISNLQFIGFVPFSEINSYFETSSIFVNTSKYEGFPNAFIQAWMNKVPTISLNVDPDSIICNNKMGFHSKTFDQLVIDVKTLLDNSRLLDEMSENAYRYVEKEHNIVNVMKKNFHIFIR